MLGAFHIHGIEFEKAQRLGNDGGSLGDDGRPLRIRCVRRFRYRCNRFRRNLADRIDRRLHDGSADSTFDRLRGNLGTFFHRRLRRRLQRDFGRNRCLGRHLRRNFGRRSDRLYRRSGGERRLGRAGDRRFHNGRRDRRFFQRRSGRIRSERLAHRRQRDHGVEVDLHGRQVDGRQLVLYGRLHRRIQAETHGIVKFPQFSERQIAFYISYFVRSIPSFGQCRELLQFRTKRFQIHRFRRILTFQRYKFFTEHENRALLFHPLRTKNRPKPHLRRPAPQTGSAESVFTYISPQNTSAIFNVHFVSDGSVRAVRARQTEFRRMERRLSGPHRTTTSDRRHETSQGSFCGDAFVFFGKID